MQSRVIAVGLYIHMQNARVGMALEANMDSHELWINYSVLRVIVKCMSNDWVYHSKISESITFSA